MRNAPVVLRRGMEEENGSRVGEPWEGAVQGR